MCRSALSLKALQSIHPTAAESQCLCWASRNSTGSIALGSILAPPATELAVHDDASRYRPITSLRLRLRMTGSTRSVRPVAVDQLCATAADSPRPERYAGKLLHV